MVYESGSGSQMLLIIEIAAGIVLGGVILRWLFSPARIAERRRREDVRFVHEIAEIQKEKERLEAKKQKAMSPEEREQYFRRRQEGG
jgi:uncharacterized protein YlxW (UPF0749 family)